MSVYEMERLATAALAEKNEAERKYYEAQAKLNKYAYTMFPNTLFEVIYSTNFNATQLRIIMLIMRHTYGCYRESHGLALMFIAEEIGTTKGNVQKQLTELIKGNVIRVISKNTKTDSRIIKVNEDYLSWIGFKISYKGAAVKKKNYRNLKASLPSTLTLEQWKSTKDYFNYECAYCGKQLKNLAQEHVIPLSKGGGCTKGNIIPSCNSCNSSKGASNMKSWYTAQTYFSIERYNKITTFIKEHKSIHDYTPLTKDTTDLKLPHNQL